MNWCFFLLTVRFSNGKNIRISLLGAQGVSVILCAYIPVWPHLILRTLEEF